MLEARLERCERRCRILTVVIVVLCGGMALMAATAKFTKIELADEGPTRAAFGLDADDKAALLMFDRKKQARVRLTAKDDEGSTLQLFDAKGRERAQFYTESDGTAGLIFKDSLGNPVGGVTVSADGRPTNLH